MKKICFFNSEKKWGGGEKWHFETSKIFQERGYEVFVLGNLESKLLDKCDENKIKTKRIKIKNRSFLNPFVIYQIIKFFKKEKIKIVICNLPIDMKLLSLSGIFVKLDKKIYRRGSAIPIKNNLLNRLFLGKLIDIIFVNSEETKRTVLKKLKAKEIFQKIKIIYNYFDPEVYDELGEENINIEKKEGELIIGNLARISKQKGQINFIEIAKILKTKDIKFKIYLAGVGELYEELYESIRNNKLEEDIIFLGFVKNVKKFMEKIDIFAFTSIWEGFGYSLIEAMYFNKSIVAYDISSNGEVLDGYLGASVVKLNDNEEFSNSLIKGIKLNSVLESGNIGKDKVLNRFEKNKIIDEIQRIID